ncbi:hypothetical protein AU210_016753 [Fusarium oxysporum f. sp. radicis-cucumerinum]|uniref:Sugar phosphate phosphatase n=1 Tax=Fusarium oxysporum f. sp. radicis-cucumerinum TaxID=327505 RepID=A0A2H3FJW1_FUSOX|nr:hypothetical protein AU210_016753 [Fusarium oxysporum f. sp. radicis-cucumerinum]
MIDDVRVTGAELAPSRALDEINSIERSLRRLREEITGDDQLCPLEDDGSADLASYNQLLLNMGELTWLNCPCCMVNATCIGECSYYFPCHLPGKGTMCLNAKRILPCQVAEAVQELASRVTQVIANPIQPLQSLDDDAARLVFSEMTEMALWGNATDLSLLTNLSLEEIQKLQGSAAIEESQRNIVDNDTSHVWHYLRKTQFES